MGFLLDSLRWLIDSLHMEEEDERRKKTSLQAMDGNYSRWNRGAGLLVGFGMRVDGTRSFDFIGFSWLVINVLIEN